MARECGAVLNLFAGTVRAGTHYSCAKSVLILRGFVRGTPTLQLADELVCDHGTLLDHRHQMQAAALLGLDRSPLADAVTEGDELFHNAGEKGDPPPRPGRPAASPGQPAARQGTTANDRPPIQGVVGRAGGEIRLTVCDDTRQATAQPEAEAKTREGVTFYRDESSAYNKVETFGRTHGTVCHSRHEHARDDDGDGIREVHCNRMEGIWTGLRDFLRPFRGVHKDYLAQYVAMFEGRTISGALPIPSRES